MKEESEITLINASEARSICNSAQDANFKKALQNINLAIQDGHNETVLFFPINLSGVEKLMKAGYAVSTVVMLMDMRTVYKISW